MEKKILVPINFKEPSVKAANYACLTAWMYFVCPFYSFKITVGSIGNLPDSFP